MHRFATWKARWSLVTLVLCAGGLLTVLAASLLYRQATAADEVRFELLTQYAQREIEHQGERLVRFLGELIVEMETTRAFFIERDRSGPDDDRGFDVPGCVAWGWWENPGSRAGREHLEELMGRFAVDLWREAFYWELAERREPVNLRLAGWRARTADGPTPPKLPESLSHYDPRSPTLAEVVSGGDGTARTHVLIPVSDLAGETRVLLMGAVYHTRLNEIPAALYPRDRDEWEVLCWMRMESVVAAVVDLPGFIAGVEARLPREISVDFHRGAADASIPVAGTPKFTAGKDSAFPLKVSQPWDWAGDPWGLRFSPTDAFKRQSQRGRAMIVLIFGLAVTGLFAAALDRQIAARLKERAMTDELLAARDALESAQHERRAFSRNLHDGAIQSLYSVRLHLGRAAPVVRDSPEDGVKELAKLQNGLDAVIAELRQFLEAETNGTAPEPAINLCNVLESFVARMRGSTSARISMKCDPGAAAKLRGDQAIQLANIAREALSNSLRHGTPRKVGMELRDEDGATVLEITDDGSGFDVDRPSHRGLGLTSIESRAREVGGFSRIESAGGRGTRVTVHIPGRRVEPFGGRKEETRTA